MDNIKSWLSKVKQSEELWSLELQGLYNGQLDPLHPVVNYINQYRHAIKLYIVPTLEKLAGKSAEEQNNFLKY